jgi:hypothetical protein
VTRSGSGTFTTRPPCSKKAAIASLVVGFGNLFTPLCRIHCAARAGRNTCVGLHLFRNSWFTLSLKQDLDNPLRTRLMVRRDRSEQLKPRTDIHRVPCRACPLNSFDDRQSGSVDAFEAAASDTA